MRLQGRRRSTNVDDRRGQRPRMGRGAGIGCGGLLLVVVFALLTGNDPGELIGMLGGAGGSPNARVDQGPGPGVDPNDEGRVFVDRVLASLEDTWNDEFQRDGRRYPEPTLVLFSGQVSSACGFNSAAVGLFYCPADSQVYLDLSFFNELSRRFGAPGDFAQAYVIAHEVGHHIQNVLGISSQVSQLQRQSRQEQANQLSVRLELQADCLAGVWGSQAAREGLLERGDLEEGFRAAAAIGDDTIQKRSRGYVVPESFTHGSSEQRQRWFKIGLESGDSDSCDTFGG